jgi:hypothetical protein
MGNGIAVVSERPPSMARMVLDRVAATPEREAFRYPSGDRWESLDWRGSPSTLRCWMRSTGEGRRPRAHTATSSVARGNVFRGA